MSSDSPSPLSIEEYRALRATIRERGTARWIVIALTFVAWGAIASVDRLAAGAPALSLVPLVVLAAGFETVFALHVGVERVGRYLQVRYESPDGALPQWEHEAMASSGIDLRTGIDPLASWLFAAAAVLNLMPFLAIGLWFPIGHPPGFAFQFTLAAAATVLFLWRIFRARGIAAIQRDRDFEFFRRHVRGG